MFRRWYPWHLLSFIVNQRGGTCLNDVATGIQISGGGSFGWTGLSIFRRSLFVEYENIQIIRHSSHLHLSLSMEHGSNGNEKQISSRIARCTSHIVLSTHIIIVWDPLCHRTCPRVVIIPRIYLGFMVNNALRCLIAKQKCFTDFLWRGSTRPFVQSPISK